MLDDNMPWLLPLLSLRDIAALTRLAEILFEYDNECRSNVKNKRDILRATS